MDNTDIILIVIIAIVALGVFGFFSIRNKEGKITDEDLTSANFLEELKEFKMKAIPERKQGFTEKDVQKELEAFFKKHFETVYREYALEGQNSKAIDFELGKGKLGIEVKLAREIIKEGGWDRALGQVIKMSKRKYRDNLIVLIAGTHDEKESPKIKEFVTDIKEQNINYEYVTIKQHEPDDPIS